MVNLSESRDFKAQGGEASVYVQGRTGYKIWHDPTKLPPLAKIMELQALAPDKRFIIPLDVLLDEKSNKPVGITMDYVDQTYVLCQLFPKAFRTRTGLTPEKVCQLVEKMREGMEFAHSQEILLVDNNEMNSLVKEDFSDLFFIDTTTYQTKSFPATALMESVRDRHRKGFSKESDYFAFAVVSFNLFVGIHPYRGKYPDIDNSVDKEQRMDARMRANVSVFHPGVHLPGACLSFDVIPPAYLKWYKAVFESGGRWAPPSSMQEVIALVTRKAVMSSADFDILEEHEFDSDVVSRFKGVTVTQDSVYINSHVVANAVPGAQIAVTPKMGKPVMAHVKDHQVHLWDLQRGLSMPALSIKADAIMSTEGRLYLHSGEGLFEVTYLEKTDTNAPFLTGVQKVANLMPNSTQLFEGVAIQSMLKTFYAVFVPSPGKSFSVRLPELEGHKVVEAKFSRGVLMLYTSSKGKYFKFIFRFDETFSSHDTTVVEDIPYTGLNFTVREDGMVLHMNHEECLEVFKNRPNSSPGITVSNHGIPGDARLTHSGSWSMFFQGNKLYQFSAKKR